MGAITKQSTEQFIERLIHQGGELREALGLTQDQIELMYAHAYEEYQKTHYNKAMQKFALLTQINHTDRRFHFGYGASLQCLGLYADAINAYMAGSMLDLADPYPTVNIAYCLMQTKQYAAAKKMLNLIVDEAPFHEAEEAYTTWRKTALHLLEEIGRSEAF